MTSSVSSNRRTICRGRRIDRIVYLMRDGRDAMVSYYHHLTAMSGHIDFHDMVANGRGLPGKWHEHVERYVANPFGAKMIIIR